MENQKNEQKFTERDMLIPIKLTAYQWHDLLKHLEFCRRFVNVERESVDSLWEEIASQLDGSNHMIYGSKKHRNAQPELFLPKEPPKEEPKEEVKESPKKPFWKFWS